MSYKPLYFPPNSTWLPPASFEAEKVIQEAFGARGWDYLAADSLAADSMMMEGEFIANKGTRYERAIRLCFDVTDCDISVNMWSPSGKYGDRYRRGILFLKDRFPLNSDHAALAAKVLDALDEAIEHLTETAD